MRLTIGLIDRRAQAALGFGVGTCLLLLSSVSCGSACDTGADEEDTVDVRSVEPVGDTYVSSSWSGPFFPFPPGKRYRFHHGLGQEPQVVVVNVSFEEYPLPGANVSQASGDEALIEAVDEEKVQVRNDTCAELWVRVSAVAAQ